MRGGRAGRAGRSGARARRDAVGRLRAARAQAVGLRRASICSRECALERWAKHKPVCRERQAVKAGVEGAGGE